MSSILPEIWAVAEDYRLGEPVTTGRPDEIRYNCPFCGDRGYHLYLNREKNAFNCYKCGKSGGVLRFLALLTGKGEMELLDEIRQQKSARPLNKKSHPAKRLSAFQLKEMGFSVKADWKAIEKRDRGYAKRTLDWLWAEWQEFKTYELCQAYKKLLLGLACGQYLDAVEEVFNRSRQIGYDLLTPVLEVYARGNDLPQWAVEGFFLAQGYLKNSPATEPKNGTA